MTRLRYVGDMQRPAGTVPRGGAKIVVFHLAIETQDIRPAPAVIAERRPAVVIRGLAARVDHGVDRARSADDLAARLIDLATGEPGLRLGFVHPVHGRIVI